MGIDSGVGLINLPQQNQKIGKPMDFEIPADITAFLD